MSNSPVYVICCHHQNHNGIYISPVVPFVVAPTSNVDFCGVAVAPTAPRGANFSPKALKLLQNQKQNFIDFLAETANRESPFVIIVFLSSYLFVIVSVCRSLHSFIHSLIHSFIYSFIYWFIFTIMFWLYHSDGLSTLSTHVRFIHVISFIH